MQTYTEIRPFVHDPIFEKKRKESLIELEDLLESNSIDIPIIDIVRGFMRIPYCFTMQSCYGHFVHDYNRDDNNVEPISKFSDEDLEIRYRIAYMAFCLQNNDSGKRLFNDLKIISEIDPKNIQFGSADWFWKRCVNSYVLQVEPERNRFEDSLIISKEEANHIEKIRDQFFTGLKKILNHHMEFIKE